MKRCGYRSCGIEFIPRYVGQVYCCKRCKERDWEEDDDQQTLVDIEPVEPVRAPDPRIP